MAVNASNYNTGPSTLLDVGLLSYNGCGFSPLFETSVSGTAVKDAANRTVKHMEYSITADGYVTLPDGANNISPTMANLRRLLTAQGGALIYQGRGMDLIINVGNTGQRDVAWGPVPELLEFQPLGGGKSAKVKWQVKVRIPEIRESGRSRLGGGPLNVPLLQFNYDTSISYSEDGYSSLSIKGTMEIPLTRVPTQGIRTLTRTVDDFRIELNDRIFRGIDLTRFRVVRRNYSVSRDKRTMEFDVSVEEKPYMDLPPDCTIARGSYNVRPARAGMGLCLWMCTLRATYTVRADRPRRNAWFAFLYLLRLRMGESANGAIPLIGGNSNPPRGLVPRFAGGIPTLWPQRLQQQNTSVASARRAWLCDFSFDEGIYLDSKTVSFSASWRLTTLFSHILLASGLWRKMRETDAQGNNLWATSVRDISGSTSWLPNEVDPAMDVIVDFGS